MNVCLYARVSSDKQKDNFSHDVQLEKMREYAKQEGWTVAIELKEADSAFLDGLERKQLRIARQMAAEGKVQAILFWSADRFTRDMGDGVLLRRELIREHGIKLFSFYPYPHEMQDDIHAVLEDWKSSEESRIRRERSMLGYIKKAEAGIYSAGNAPFGYTLEGRRHTSRLEIDPEEERIVRLIFEWYVLEGVGSFVIAERLNAGGYKTPDSNRRAGLWSSQSVRVVLRNETYAGVWYAKSHKTQGKKTVNLPRGSGIPVPVPSIITRDMWERAQAKLKTRHNTQKREVRYLLSSRSNCQCGKANIGQCHTNGKTTKMYRHYRCLSNQYASGKCGRPFFPVEPVDGEVWEFVKELIRDPERLVRGWQEM
jgi:site-specific DNA recombinase